MQVEVAVIGTGWCGGIRAETLSRSALVSKLHICEIKPDRLAEVRKLTNPATATLDYHDIVKNPNITVVYVCTTPEHTHFPIARDCLQAGKHVLLEKPIALELWEADTLITLAKRGQSQVHHRLLAALQHQGRLRQEEDHRRHARQAGERHGQPASLAQPGQEDRLARATVAGGHGIHARPRFRVLAAGAGQADPRLLAGRLRLHEARQRLLRHHVDHGDHGQRHAGRDRRRLEPAPELSQLLRHLDRDHGHGGLAVPRRYAARQLADHGVGGHAVSDVDHAGRAGRPRVRRADGAGDDPFPGIGDPRPPVDGDARKRPHGDGGLPGRRPIGRAQRAHRPAAVERGDSPASPR